MKEAISLFRRRFEPEETIFLKDDIILFHDEHKIISSWNCLKPRKDIASGISAYLMDENIKVSKVMDHDGNLVYWYCDIIDTIHDPTENSFIFCDLLVDILVYRDGRIKVVDLDELGDALDHRKITKEQAVLALRAANRLLAAIYDNDFSKYQELIEAYAGR